MELTDEELYVAQLAITIGMDVFNRMQRGNRAGLDPAIMEGLVRTFGVINTHTSIGVRLVEKMDVWHRDHPGVQQRIAGMLQDSDGGSRMVGLDGKPLLG